MDDDACVVEDIRLGSTLGIFYFSFYYFRFWFIRVYDIHIALGLAFISSFLSLYIFPFLFYTY